MKKFIAAALASAIALSSTFCGYATESSSVSGDDEIWQSDKTVDDFGDVTDDSQDIVKSTITGAFTNTATANSDVTVMVFVSENETGLHNRITFRLFEYGDNPVTFYKDEDVTFKIKVDDEEHDYKLNVDENGSDPYLYKGVDFLKNATTLGGYSSGYEYYKTLPVVADDVVEKLQAGKDIRCIIETSTSKYLFTMTAGNFPDLWTFQPMHEILGEIIDDMNTIGRHDYFEERKEKYSIVSKDELEELLVDNPWMRTTINDEKEDDSWMITYTADGKRITYGTWVNDEYKKIEHEENEYSIDDDGQLIEANEGTYQIRKIEDGFYLAYQTAGPDNDPNASENTIYLYTEFDKSGNIMYATSQ